MAVTEVVCVAETLLDEDTLLLLVTDNVKLMLPLPVNVELLLALLDRDGVTDTEEESVEDAETLVETVNVVVTVTEAVFDADTLVLLETDGEFSAQP